jgi:hypothetical protein
MARPFLYFRSGNLQKVAPQLWHGKSKRICRQLKGLTASQQQCIAAQMWQWVKNGRNG